MKKHPLYHLFFLWIIVSCKNETDFTAEPFVDIAIPSYVSQPESLQDIPVQGIELGRLLFFDKNLSSNKNVSCNTCHEQEHAIG